MEFNDIVTISQYIKSYGSLALLVLFALIVIQCHIPILPFGVVSATCGFLFGFKLGIAISWISVVIGSSIAFYLYRQLRLNKLAQNIVRGYKLNMADELLFGFIVISHNIPVVPIAIPNIIAALSKMPFSKFLLATSLGLFIPSVSFAAFGSGIESFLVRPSYLTMIPVIIILVILYFIKKYSHKFSELINHDIFKK